MTEQSGPRELVSYAVAAEQAGFDFEVMSDHFSPWLTEQGHAPYAWTTLGAVAQATERVGLMTYVTCPTLRYHPAVVAQKAATLQILAEGRFTLGLGSGENLNEHVVGEGWPAIAERQDMLAEAIEVIRALHTGELVDHRGDFFQVDSARIWDLPEEGVDIGVAVAGDRAIARFAPMADHLVGGRAQGRASSSPGTASTAPRASARTPARSGRSRSAGTPTRTPPSRGRTSSSAGSAAAGRSTPTCPPRPASPARRRTSGPRTSRSPSPADPTSTRWSRPSRPTGRPGSPTSPSCRSATRDRTASSARRPARCSRSCGRPLRESCPAARQLIAVNRPRRCVGASISSRIASARSSAEIVDAPSASRSSTSPPRT